MAEHSQSHRAHSRFGGSVVYRYKKCPGCVNAAKGMPNRTTIYAATGTVAHGICEAVLLDDTYTLTAWSYLDQTFHLEGHDVVVDLEMIEGVELYVNTIRAAWAEDEDAELWIEMRLDLRKIHPDMYGTSDAVIYFPKRRVLRVYDFKYGFKYVDADENSQLLFYALGAMLNTKASVDRIEIVIVQPRGWTGKPPIRSWSLPAIDILDFATELRKAAEATEDPDAPRVPGLHCDYCPAAAICPELREAVMALIKRSFAPVGNRAVAYDPEALRAALAELPMVENWVKATRNFAFEKALKNELPGFKVVEKRPQRDWRDAETAAAMLPGLGINPAVMYDRPALRSPAQIEKLLNSDQKKKLAPLIRSQSSGLQLALESDESTAVKRESASSAFRAVATTQSIKATANFFD